MRKLWKSFPVWRRALVRTICPWLRTCVRCVQKTMCKMRRSPREMSSWPYMNSPKTQLRYQVQAQLPIKSGRWNQQNIFSITNNTVGIHYLPEKNLLVLFIFWEVLHLRDGLVRLVRDTALTRSSSVAGWIFQLHSVHSTDRSTFPTPLLYHQTGI